MTPSEVATIEAEIMENFQRLNLPNRKRVLHKMLDAMDEPLADSEGRGDQMSGLAGRGLSPEAIESFIGMFKDDVTDLSTTTRETLETYYRSRYADSD